MRLRNVIYYHNVLGLGGTTTYVLELVKKYYKTKDITLVYKYGDTLRVKEYKKYVRCIKIDEVDQIECDTLFIQYDGHEVLNKIKAKHYYQVIHAQYKTNKVNPKTNPLFEKYICVSEIVKEEYQELTGLKDSDFIISPNPLLITEQEKEPPIVIGSFTRLSWEKGKGRMDALIQKLDENKVNYLWLVYTDSADKFYSNKVIKQKPITNPRSIIALCDIVAQLSNCEGDCYAIKEAKAIINKVLITPCKSFFEMGCDKDKDIVLDYDLNNIDEVVEKIKLLKHNPVHSDFKVKEDKYNELLVDSISNYQGGLMKYLVKAKEKFQTIVDSEVGRTRKTNEQWEVSEARKDILVSANLVEVVSEVGSENAVAPEVKTATKPMRTRKATRKTTKVNE